MPLNPKFGPAAQTPAQRANVLARMQDAIPYLKRNLTAIRQQLYARYVAGELSWLEVKQVIDNAGTQRQQLAPGGIATIEVGEGPPTITKI